MSSNKHLVRGKATLFLAVILSLAFIIHSVLVSNEEESAAYKTGMVEKKAGEGAGANQQLTDLSHSLGAPIAVPPSPVDSFPAFRSIPLFQFPESHELVDLYAPESEPLHPPIPNLWWRDHQIALQYADAPMRDEDGDGFTNMEEFMTDSDPSDPQKYPELVAKLKVEGSSYVKWRVYFSSDIGEGKYQFKYRDSRQRRLRSKYLNEGAYFFDRHPAQSRFILQRVEERVGEVAGAEALIKYAVVKDANTLEVFDIQKGMKTPYTGKDYTVTFSLKALNQGEKTFKLRENVKFNLPSGALDGNGTYYFRRVKDGHAEIDYLTKGLQKTIRIPL